jgi:signal transduction histidine kinase
LAIVKSLIDTLEGSVDVETAMGKGTTFVITLPRQYVEKSEVS